MYFSKKYCEYKKVKSVINELIEKTGITPSADASNNYQMMTWEQLKELNTSSLFNVGGHTLYHNIMTSQEIEIAKLDIDITLNLLSYNLQQTINHFSYPEGQENSYNEAIISTLTRKGIICSPCAIDGVNVNEDLFNLKRIMPNFNGRKFPMW